MPDPGRTAPPTAKAEQTARTKQQLLDAAAALFAERGYQETSVQAIGGQAGVSRGSIFWHFGSKEGLLWALAERDFGRWESEVLAPTVGDAIGIEALRRTLAAHRAFLEDDQAGLRLFLVLMFEALGPRPELAGAFAQLHRRLAEIGGSWLAAGIEAGDVRPDLNPQVAASLVTGSLGGIAFQFFLDPVGFDAGAAYEELTRVFERGMAVK